MNPPITPASYRTTTRHVRNTVSIATASSAQPLLHGVWDVTYLSCSENFPNTFYEEQRGCHHELRPGNTLIFNQPRPRPHLQHNYTFLNHPRTSKCSAEMVQAVRAESCFQWSRRFLPLPLKLSGLISQSLPLRRDCLMLQKHKPELRTLVMLQEVLQRLLTLPVNRTPHAKPDPEITKITTDS